MAGLIRAPVFNNTKNQIGRATRREVRTTRIYLQNLTKIFAECHQESPLHALQLMPGPAQIKAATSSTGPIFSGS